MPLHIHSAAIPADSKYLRNLRYERNKEIGRNALTQDEYGEIIADLDNRLDKVGDDDGRIDSWLYRILGYETLIAELDENNRLLSLTLSV